MEQYWPCFHAFAQTTVNASDQSKKKEVDTHRIHKNPFHFMDSHYLNNFQFQF